MRLIAGLVVGAILFIIQSYWMDRVRHDLDYRGIEWRLIYSTIAIVAIMNAIIP